MQAACAAIVLHVLNYNLTARIEHKTRIFTKLLGPNAVYYYAVYLVASAALRDLYIKNVLSADSGSMLDYVEVDGLFLGLNFQELLKSYGMILFGLGIMLNLWTLYALGIKGMYNGMADSPLF